MPKFRKGTTYFFYFCCTGYIILYHLILINVKETFQTCHMCEGEYSEDDNNRAMVAVKKELPLIVDSSLAAASGFMSMTTFFFFLVGVERLQESYIHQQTTPTNKYNTYLKFKKLYDFVLLLNMRA